MASNLAPGRAVVGEFRCAASCREPGAPPALVVLPDALLHGGA
jgi:hypothetical protein